MWSFIHDSQDEWQAKKIKGEHDVSFPFEMDKTQYINATLLVACIPGPQKYRQEVVLFYNLTSDFAKCTFSSGLPAACRSLLCKSMLSKIKVSQASVFWSDTRWTREASALISRSQIWGMLMLISAIADRWRLIAWVEFFWNLVDVAWSGFIGLDSRGSVQVSLVH